MTDSQPDWGEVQRELNELFHRYDLSVATGLTREGVTIMSQDERVDAKNIGEVVAYGGDPYQSIEQERWRKHDGG